MTFDGYPVNQGDTIHHALYGSGTVSRATADGAKVRFGDQEIELPADGKLGAMKVWFWQPPVILSPAKPSGMQADQYRILVLAAHTAIFGR